MARKRKKHPQKWHKRNEQKRSCPTGKQGYKHRGEAEAAVQKGADLRPYECDECKLWHLGNRLSRRYRRLLAEGRMTDARSGGL